MTPPDFIRSAVGRKAPSPPTVRHAPPGSQATEEPPCAGLGDDHPVSCAIKAVESTRRQCINLGAVLAGSVIALLQGARWAEPLAGSAGAMLAVLGVLFAYRLQDRHDRVVDFILDGHENDGPPIVQRERDRLLSARSRSQLAESVAQLAREAMTLPRVYVRVAPPLFARRVVAPVAAELMEISGLLIAGPTSARAVARVDRLIGFATSPLYGDDLDALRSEVNAVRDLLAGHPEDAPSRSLTATR